MEIRPLQESSAIAPKTKPKAPGPESKPSRRERDEDRYAREERTAGDAPFWLVRMASDRMARRRYQSARERKAAMAVERRWIAALVQSATPELSAWQTTANRLADWQRLADRIASLAAVEPPQVVWLPDLREGRGQFWFRVEGSLVRLNPRAPGSPRDWIATVAHETFHHVQQELVSAFYQGEPLEGDRAVLAAYYRDARATYETLGPGCPPERHREQDLERGAWAFGEAIARTIPLGR
ncbi:MAG TPA: hypothetical protein V6D47_11155 [Oscillatoriaceae cyanobacterium]